MFSMGRSTKSAAVVAASIPPDETGGLQRSRKRGIRDKNNLALAEDTLVADLKEGTLTTKATSETDVPVAKKAKTPTTRAVATLFVRNIPFAATNSELEAFFSDFGPVRGCFVVGSSAECPRPTDAALVEKVAKESTAAARAVNKGFGFVHFTLAEDAAKTIEQLPEKKFKGRKLKAEFALRKHLKGEASEGLIVKEERNVKIKRKLAIDNMEDGQAAKKAKKTQPSTPKPSKNYVILSRIKLDGSTASKKVLYKKIRKCGIVAMLEYPFAESNDMAKVEYADELSARKAIKKLDQHVFKGAKLEAKLEIDAKEQSALSSKIASGKQHRLIIRNLPFVLSEAALRAHFETIGPLVELHIPTKSTPNSNSGKPTSRGFAFAQYETKQAAGEAMAKLNGGMFEGRMIAVDWALAKDFYEKARTEEASKAIDDKSDVKVDDNEEMEVDVVGDDGSDENNINDEEDEDEDVDIEGDDDNDRKKSPHTAGPSDNSATVFVRNLAFETNEDSLNETFSRFGDVVFAKIVRDPASGASRGTAFIKFSTADQARAAIEASSRLTETIETRSLGTRKALQSVLIDESLITGHELMLDGRPLIVLPAVDKGTAARLVEAAKHMPRPSDKRNLYLAHESVANPTSPAFGKLTLAEKEARETSAKQRLKKLKENPNFFLSPTRIAVSHLAKDVDEKWLRKFVLQTIKAATKLDDKDINIVGKEVYEESKKLKPRLIQVKVVRSALSTASKVAPSQNGKSKGYAFVEFAEPAHSLLLVRFLTQLQPDTWVKIRGELRPIAEFAMENMAVIKARAKRIERNAQTMKSKIGLRASAATERRSEKTNKPAVKPRSGTIGGKLSRSEKRVIKRQSALPIGRDSANATARTSVKNFAPLNIQGSTIASDRKKKSRKPVLKNGRAMGTRGRTQRIK